MLRNTEEDHQLPGAGYRVNTSYRLQGTGYKLQGNAKYKLPVTCYKLPGLYCRLMIKF
ncbi:hypothetical protein GGD38_002389 [Chitinophagaceae bacterium OAS944]|nr:hypothetical protein [Chitinophagaceae bacterium OAS944]